MRTADKDEEEEASLWMDVERRRLGTLTALRTAGGFRHRRLSLVGMQWPLRPSKPHLGGFVEGMRVQHGEGLQGLWGGDPWGDHPLLAGLGQRARQLGHGSYHVLRDACLALHQPLQCQLTRKPSRLLDGRC